MPPMTKQLTDADEIVKLKCDVHPWMTGYVAGVQPPVLRGHGRRRQLQDHRRPAGQLHGRGVARALWRENGGDHGRRGQTGRDGLPVRGRSRRRTATRPGCSLDARWPLFGYKRARCCFTARVVHRFAVATAVATYLLILIGGLVHGTGSSLACPDWPTCYGSLMPKMEGGVLVEHSHRLAAATVVILTLALAVMLTAPAATPSCGRCVPSAGWRWAWCSCRRCWAASPSAAAAHARLDGAHRDVAAVLPDAALRRGAVARRAARSARPAALPTASVARGSPSVRWPSAVYFQMVLGGLVRHSGAALACTDVPLCRGSLWPDAHPTVLIQALHRLTRRRGGARWCSRRRSSRCAHAGPRRDLRALAVARARAGRASRSRSASSPCTTFLDLATVEAHLGVATALLATQVLVALRADPLAVPGRVSAAWFASMVSLGKPRITGMVVITFLGGLWLAPGEIAHWRADHDPDRHRAARRRRRTRSTCTWSATPTR